MEDTPTNPISSNVICVLICHAVLWKFSPLQPASASPLPKTLKKLTRTRSYFGGGEKGRMWRPGSEFRGYWVRRVSACRNRGGTWGWLVPQSPFWLRLRKNPCFRLFPSSRFSPVYWNVFILCHFVQSFTHKKGNNIARCLQNLESPDKDLRSEAEHSALFIYSPDRL